MQLADYSNLIKELPYHEQSFVTSKDAWSNFKNDEVFSKVYNKIFIQKTVKLSRHDLFNCCQESKEAAIFLIVFWGYPLGYTRPNTMSILFPKFLKTIPKLSTYLYLNGDINNKELKGILDSLSGVGLSTFTKFLYFFQMTVNGEKAVILDNRIIKVLQTGNFKELSTLNKITETNKDKQYINYLQIMSDVANANNFSVDQLELFLFMFGNNLKTI